MLTPNDAPIAGTGVIDWLLDSDPALRWQILRDLTDAPAEAVHRERSRVAREGWGASLLALQREDGQWGTGEPDPLWWTNLYSLIYLRDLGAEPDAPEVKRAIDRVRDRVTWGEEWGYSPFFEGEVEPCINGRVVALGAYFGVPSRRLVQRLLGEQLQDGGWNCEAERGSVRSSFHTTLCVLEGLLAYEQLLGEDDDVRAARERAHEYLLERRLLRRLSTGAVIRDEWAHLAFPPLWHYDVLRGLDYFRAAGVGHDARMDEALTVVRHRRRNDGSWPLEVRHRGTLYTHVAGDVGAPNRWVTLRALRVLAWFEREEWT